MRDSTFELSEKVLAVEGSLREVSHKLNLSRSYVSQLKKAREQCSEKVIENWKGGNLTWGVVRALSDVPNQREQDFIVGQYLLEVEGGSKAARGAARAEAIRRAKIFGNVASPDSVLSEVFDEAQAMYASDDCQVFDKGITPVKDRDGINGYWVPAQVWVPAANIS